MKNRIFFTAILVLIFSSSFGQNSKHSVTSGKIIFDVTYPESQLDAQTIANLPRESVMYFKNDLSKVEVAMPLGKTIMLANNKTGDGTMLMDMMGKKYAIKTNMEDLKKQNKSFEKPKIELTRQTKMIAGYSCTKAIITVNTESGEKSFDAWFTNELKAKNSISSQIDGINGFLMEFVNNQNGMNMKMTERSVEVKDIADSEFEIPKDYEITTMEDLQKNMGGMK